VVFIPEKFLIRRFSVTDKKYVLKAFAIASSGTPKYYAY
jgi:hypothetical protein